MSLNTKANDVCNENAPLIIYFEFLYINLSFSEHLCRPVFIAPTPYFLSLVPKFERGQENLTHLGKRTSEFEAKAFPLIFRAKQASKNNWRVEIIFQKIQPPPQQVYR